MSVTGNAHVARSARVDNSAQVGARARIVNRAYVGGRARVFDDAVVDDHARVVGRHDEVMVHGSTVVAGSAHVGDGADLATSRHLLTVTALGPDNDTLTVYRARPARYADENTWTWTHRFHLAGRFGYLDELADAPPAGWTRWHLDELDVALDLADLRREAWETEVVTYADLRRWQLRDADLERAPRRIGWAEARARRARP